MSKRSLLQSILLSIAILACLPAMALALAQVSVSSGGDGVFVLSGSGMQTVAAVHLLVSYDSAALANPRVELGTLANGRMNASNLNGNPIQIAFVGITAIGSAGSNGTIAKITFDRTGSGPGSIDGVSGSMIDPSGKTVAMSPAFISNPAAASDQPATDSTNTGGTAGTGLVTTTSGSGSTGSQPFVAGGTVSLPGSDSGSAPKTAQSAPEVNTPPPAPPAAPREMPAPSPEPAEEKAPPAKSAEQPAPAPAPAPAPQPIVSTLERFQGMQGPKSVASLTALFKRDPATGYTQSPAIAIADGKGTVKLVIANVPGDRAPNFAFSAASYVSLSRNDEGGWVVEVRPEAGVVKASVTMLAGGVMQEFPLIVAPKAEVRLTKGAEVSEADFQLFLKERGTAAASKFDLNGDGKRDFLDDYIFTANYLVQTEQKSGKKGAEQPKAK